jgi:hypothetical protein
MLGRDFNLEHTVDTDGLLSFGSSIITIYDFDDVLDARTRIIIFVLLP